MADWILIVLTSSVVAGFISSGVTVTANYFYGEHSRKKERLYKEKREAYIKAINALQLQYINKLHILETNDQIATICNLKIFGTKEIYNLFTRISDEYAKKGDKDQTISSPEFLLLIAKIQKDLDVE